MRLLALVILVNVFTPGDLQADIAAGDKAAVTAVDPGQQETVGIELLNSPSEFPGIETLPADFPPPFFIDESLPTPIVNNIDTSIAEQLRQAVERSARLRPISDSQNSYLDRGSDGGDYKLQQQIQTLSDHVARPKPVVEKTTAPPPVDFDRETIKD